MVVLNNQSLIAIQLKAAMAHHTLNGQYQGRAMLVFQSVLCKLKTKQDTSLDNAMALIKALYVYQNFDPLHVRPSSATLFWLVFNIKVTQYYAEVSVRLHLAFIQQLSDQQEVHSVSMIQKIKLQRIPSNKKITQISLCFYYHDGSMSLTCFMPQQFFPVYFSVI